MLVREVVHRIFGPNAIILSNASSLVGTTVVTSGLGFVYWWVAARHFTPEMVGLASAAISAMMLLGSIGALGLGTLLIGELPRRPRKAGSLIATSLLVAGTASGGLGILFAVAAARMSFDLQPLSNSLGSTMLFASGVALTGVILVLDQAVIGLLRGEIQLWRNICFAATKLVVLFIVGLWFANLYGLTIYATWVVGILVSLLFLAGIVAIKSVRIAYRPQWRLIRSGWREALRHHALNMALLIPALVLPILVTVILSARVNASFYVAWMIASFAFVVPTALTTVLYAVGAADPSVLAQKTRFTLKLSFLAGILVSCLIMISAHHILGSFGSAYAEQAEWSLRFLVLGVFPIIIKVHYVAICRVYDQISGAALRMAGGGFLEVVLAWIGASLGGLLGLSVGWVVAVCFEAIILAPTVAKIAMGEQPPMWRWLGKIDSLKAGSSASLMSSGSADKTHQAPTS